MLLSCPSCPFSLCLGTHQAELSSSLAALSRKNPIQALGSSGSHPCGCHRQQFLVSLPVSVPLPLLPHAQTQLVRQERCQNSRGGWRAELWGNLRGTRGVYRERGSRKHKKLPQAGPELGAPLHTESALSSRETSWCLCNQQGQKSRINSCRSALPWGTEPFPSGSVYPGTGDKQEPLQQVNFPSLPSTTTNGNQQIQRIY